MRNSLHRDELYKWKNIARQAFDPICRQKEAELKPLHGRWAKHLARDEAYRWLAQQLRMRVDYCHIAYFDIELCRRVIDICNAHVESQEGEAA